MRFRVLLALGIAAFSPAAIAELPVQSNAPAWTSGEYRYDGAGNVVAIGDRTYAYDAVSRLTRAQIGASLAPTYGYEYDAYGNRTAYVVNQQRVSVPVASATNRFTDATYDAVGNQRSRGSTAATFDGFGMMTSYRFDAINAETFVYTASDERIGVLRGTEWTWSFRDARGRVIRQYRSSLTDSAAPWLWIEDFVYRDSLLLGSERVPTEGGRRHYHLDHLGSPRLVTGDSGSVVSEHDFLPFGEERTAVGQQLGKGFDREHPHRFTGHERDFDTAAPNSSSAYVDYLHARYYAANTGRFLSADPGKDWDPYQPQSWNLYSYVRNNPMNRTDPTGKYVCVGSAGGCGTVEAGIAKMKEAAAAMKRNDPQRRDLQQVIEAYGAPNDPKTKIKTVLVNPTMADGVTPALPRKITGQVGENGVVAVSLVNIKAKAGGDSAKAFAILGGTLTHEGRHHLQPGFASRQGPVSLLSHLHAELQAYTLAKGYYQALGSAAMAPDPVRGAWQSSMEACRQVGCVP